GLCFDDERKLSRWFAVRAELFETNGFFVRESRTSNNVLILFLREAPDDLLRRNRRRRWRDRFRADAVDVVIRGRRKGALLGSLHTACRKREDKYAEKKRAAKCGLGNS